MSENVIPDVNSSDVLETVETVESAVETKEVEQEASKLAKLAAAAKQAVSEGLEAVKDKVDDIVDTVSDKIEDVVEDGSDKIEDAVEDGKDALGDAAEAVSNFADKTLDEILDAFRAIGNDVERMKRSKEVEAIKSAFYKRLIKEKGEDETAQEEAEAPQEEVSKPNPFAAIETEFKSLYNDYKREKNEFNKQLDKEREDNLAAKKAVVEELKDLVEKQEDVNATFPAFREIQNKWKAIGPVPAQSFREVNDTYQFYVEKFYDMVKINRELRDLDFKKNLEAKEAFCQAAEKLAENENIVEAFHELQKLHEQWKEFGPVAKEYRDEIWNRFKAATAVVNKKYQSHFEGLKEKQGENKVAKEALCEKVEAIAEKEVSNSNEWNSLSKEIEDIQKEWKAIGFASKKDNQKLYDRFRAACDKFFEKKRVFYLQYKDNMNENLEKKMALIEAAEALKNSTEWKKATDQFINLQKQWKEIGAVPRKKSEQLWKRFRATCDEFFAERDKQAKPENDFYANLKAKKKLIEEINAYETGKDAEADRAAAAAFTEKWQAVGFVPFKEKDAIQAAYKEAMAKFGGFQSARRGGFKQAAKAPKSEKEILIQKYNSLQQDIDTYENNIGFFSMSKNSAPLISQMQQRIEEAKAELASLKEQIRKVEESEVKEEEQ